jgi:hypothetical protein
MHEFLFEPCILRCLNFIYKKISLRFYDPFLRSEFILHFPCRVKNVLLTTLHVMFFPLWNEVIVHIELICKCLSDNMYIKLTCMRILYEEITCVYKSLIWQLYKWFLYLKSLNYPECYVLILLYVVLIKGNK